MTQKTAVPMIDLDAEARVFVIKTMAGLAFDENNMNMEMSLIEHNILVLFQIIVMRSGISCLGIVLSVV